MDRTWRGVIPGVPNEPYEFTVEPMEPVEQWLEFGHFSCGAYRRRFEKKPVIFAMFCDFHGLSFAPQKTTPA